jgi:hypothetical protein
VGSTQAHTDPWGLYGDGSFGRRGRLSEKMKDLISPKASPCIADSPHGLVPWWPNDAGSVTPNRAAGRCEILHQFCPNWVQGHVSNEQRCTDFLPLRVAVLLEDTRRRAKVGGTSW